MQVNYRNDLTLLVDAKAATPAKVKEVQSDPEVASYAFHKPGSVYEARDGRRYEVQKDGSWKVLNKPRSRVKRLRAERQGAA